MTKYAYFEGQFVPVEEAKVGIMTHALHYGTACFEGIRAYWNEHQEQLYVLKMVEHYRRMERSTRILRMKLPLSPEELAEISLELLRMNNFREDVYIRPLAYKSEQVIGVRLHGLADGFLIYTAPFGKYLDIDKGVRCMVSSWRRVDDNAAPARAKISGAYINCALTKSEAVENGYDEAIVLTQEGHVSEGSAENLFIVVDGKLVTPSVSENILEGITRASIMQLAKDELGIPTTERPIDRTELYTCDECFLCGTGAEISPVVEIDRRPVGDGRIGMITAQLFKLYFDIVRGNVPEYRHWYRPVYCVSETVKR